MTITMSNDLIIRWEHALATDTGDLHNQYHFWCELEDQAPRFGPFRCPDCLITANHDMWADGPCVCVVLTHDPDEEPF
jgi:hypothetical protein